MAKGRDIPAKMKTRAIKKMRNYMTRLSILFLLMLGLPAAQAEGVDIQSASSSLIGDIYAIDADIEFHLDEEVQNALDHGVELNIDIYIVIKRSRKWLWDPTVVESVLRHKLEYYPLSDLYILSNIVNGNRSQFRSLEEATSFLGTIRNYMILNQASLEADANYVGLIRAKLNIDNLPPPLQPTAHVSKRWRLESPWYEWVIR